MIATVTNRGKPRRRIIDEAFNPDKLIGFPEALIKDTGKKVFLIPDNPRVHHSKPVKSAQGENRAVLFTRLQPGAEGRTVECRLETCHLNQGSGTHEGQAESGGNRTHADAGKITRTHQKILPGFTRKICFVIHG